MLYKKSIEIKKLNSMIFETSNYLGSFIGKVYKRIIGL